MELDLRKLHILVVEDLYPMRELLADIVRTMGVGTVTCAADGSEGYQVYLDEKPDIIITDWQMPHMDGIEMVKKIRQDRASHNRTIPIVMITGFNAKNRITTARDNGVTEFLIKPFTASDIARRITHIITKPRDFVFAPGFVGPDRRRKETEGFSGQSNRQQETPNKIKPKNDLQLKTGAGTISAKDVERSQKIINDNTVDFRPIAQLFLDQLKTAINKIQQQKNPGSKYLEDLIYPIMQLKANARIFKYDLVGDLSMITLDFLENINEINQHVIDIVEAHAKSIQHIIQNSNSGDGGEVGESLQEEFSGACKRYMNYRAKLMQDTLKEALKLKNT